MAITYATWDPANAGSKISLSGGDLVAANNGTSDAWGIVISTISKTTGKWYWEITFTQSGAIQIPDWQVGIAIAGINLESYLGTQAQGWDERTLNLSGHNGGDFVYGTSQPGNGATIGVLLDMDGGTIAITDATGTSNGTMFSGLSAATFAAVALNANGGTPCIITANFGATAFAYSVPAGYNAGLYTGTASVNSQFFMFMR